MGEDASRALSACPFPLALVYATMQASCKPTMAVESSAYLFGRTEATLRDPFKGQDHIFAAERLDGKKITGASFAHCTFANVSFKQVTLEHALFTDCVFIGCYFRRANLRDCSFYGCRFVDCEFPNLAVSGSVFRYSRFQDCFIPFDAIRLSLPPEPNLRAEVARNLSHEAAKLGVPAEARVFRMCEIKATEEHLRLAVLGASEWYERHYPPMRRIGAALALTGSILNRYLWGYGEKALVLVKNLVFLALVVFPLAYYFLPIGELHSDAGNVGFLDAVYFSLQNIIPAAISSGVTAIGALSRGLAAFEALLGILIAGLLVSYLFRWILRR